MASPGGLRPAHLVRAHGSMSVTDRRALIAIARLGSHGAQMRLSESPSSENRRCTLENTGMAPPTGLADVVAAPEKGKGPVDTGGGGASWGWMRLSHQ